MSRNAPVRHTCPDIDKCIGWIKDVENYIHAAMEAIDIADGDLGSENKEAESALRNAKGYLNNALSYNFFGALEELRRSNSELRDWGHGLLNELEKLENEYA